jgi:hypothetical protein
MGVMKSSHFVQVEHAAALALPIQRHQPAWRIDQCACEHDLGTALAQSSPYLGPTVSSVDPSLNQKCFFSILPAAAITSECRHPG